MTTTRAAAAAAATAASAEPPLRPILLNGAALLGAYVVPRALTFAAALVAARLLGPAQFGVYGTAASCAMILSIFTTLGMLPLLVRELARAPERASSLLAAATRVKLGGAVLMITVALLACWLLEYSVQLTAAVIILALGWTVWGLAENIGAWYQARERMQTWFKANTLFGIVSGLLGIVAVALTRDVLWFCAAFASGQLAAYVWLRRSRPVETPPSADVTAAVRALAADTMPFAVAFLVLTLFYKFDLILLHRLQTPDVAGIYAAGYKLIDVVHALAVVAAGAVYPRLARVVRADGRTHTAAASRALELFLLAAVPAAAMLFLLRAPLTALFFGDAYGATTSVLALLAPAICALAVNILAGYLLSAAHRVGLLGVCYAGAVSFKFALAWYWIPQYGARGAAAAMLVAEVGLACVLLAVLYARRIAAVRARMALLTAGAVLCAALPGLLLRDMPVAAAVACGVSICALYMSGAAITASERAAFVAAVAPLRRRT